MHQGLHTLSCRSSLGIWVFSGYWDPRPFKLVALELNRLEYKSLPCFFPPHLLKKQDPLLKRWEYQTTSHASWEIRLRVKKQQLELDMEQQSDSKLGKE